MFYIRYLTMHKVHMHAGAIRQLLYGCAFVREITHSLKLVDYPPAHTRKTYNNLHVELNVEMRLWAYHTIYMCIFINNCSRACSTVFF